MTLMLEGKLIFPPPFLEYIFTFLAGFFHRKNHRLKKVFAPFCQNALRGLCRGPEKHIFSLPFLRKN